MRHQQGVPELVGDARARTLFGEHARLQRLLYEVKHSIFAKTGRIGLHCTDDVKFKGAAEHRGFAQQPLAGTGETTQAQIEGGGDRIRQGGDGVDGVDGMFDLIRRGDLNAGGG